MNIEFRVRGAKKLSAQIREITVMYKRIPRKTAEESYRLALKIAPDARKNKDPRGGGTIQALSQQNLTKGPSVVSGKIVLRQPTVRKGNRPYHMWMHGLGKYNIAPYIKSGDPHFMYTVFNFMKKDSLKRARKKK